MIRARSVLVACTLALTFLLGCAASPSRVSESPELIDAAPGAPTAIQRSAPSPAGAGQAEPWPERFRRRGFSVKPPPGASWWINEAEQTDSMVVYRRRGADPEAGEAGREATFFYAALRAWKKVPESNEEFDAFVLDVMTHGLFPKHVERLSHEMTPVSLQGQYCIRFEARARETQNAEDPAGTFFHHDAGLFCQHPGAWDNYVLARYSARRRASEPSPAVRLEVDGLLRGLVLETAPEVPVVAEPAAGKTAAGLPRVVAPLRRATCDDLVGMWVRVPLDDPIDQRSGSLAPALSMVWFWGGRLSVFDEYERARRVFSGAAWPNLQAPSRAHAAV